MALQIRCFPRSDSDFCERVLRRARELEHAVPASELADRLATELRPSFPAIAVRPAEPLAESFGQHYLYAYRDGRVLIGSRRNGRHEAERDSGFVAP